MMYVQYLVMCFALQAERSTPAPPPPLNLCKVCGPEIPLPSLHTGLAGEGEWGMYALLTIVP